MRSPAGRAIVGCVSYVPRTCASVAAECAVLLTTEGLTFLAVSAREGGKAQQNGLFGLSRDDDRRSRLGRPQVLGDILPNRVTYGGACLEHAS
jgi:hypothetical protein